MCTIYHRGIARLGAQGASNVLAPCYIWEVATSPDTSALLRMRKIPPACPAPAASERHTARFFPFLAHTPDATLVPHRPTLATSRCLSSQIISCTSTSMLSSQPARMLGMPSHKPTLAPSAAGLSCRPTNCYLILPHWPRTRP